MQTTSSRQPPAASVIDEMKTRIGDQIRASGAVRCDVDELDAHREAAKARVRSHAVAPFDPQAIASDRELASRLKDSTERLGRLRDKRDVLETRLTNAREQTERMPAPSRSMASVLATGTGVFTLCFAPTIYSVFFAGMDDALLAWVISVAIGAAVGGFLCLLLLNSEEGPR